MKVKRQRSGWKLLVQMYLKLPRQEFLSWWATVLINYSSRTSECASNKETGVFERNMFDPVFVECLV